MNENDKGQLEVTFFFRKTKYHIEMFYEVSSIYKFPCFFLFFFCFLQFYLRHHFLKVHVIMMMNDCINDQG